MRIVRVIARLNVGGPARHAVLLSRGLDARGYRGLLVFGETTPDEGSFADLAEAAGVCTERVSTLGRRLHAWSDLQAFSRLLRVLWRECPDIVHTHTAKAGALGRLGAALFNLMRRRSRRALVVHTFHGHVFVGYFPRVATWAVRLAERLLGRLTDVIVAISDEQRRELVDVFRIAPAERVVTIPLGLELGALYAINSASPHLRRELEIEAGATVFGFVGRFVPIKNLSLLLQAFAAAALDNAVLLLVGDGERRAQLEALARTLRIERAVRFTGWRRDLERIYATIDVVVLTSDNEGTPVALIEGMAAGRPSISTAVGGVPDVVRADVTGLLVRRGDHGAFARAMRALGADPARRAVMGAAARAAVRDRYSSQRLVADMDAMYRARLLLKRAGRP